MSVTRADHQTVAKIIFVKTLVGTTKTFELTDEQLAMTVRDFKAFIAEKVGVPVDQQRLLYSSLTLDDMKPITEACPDWITNLTVLPTFKKEGRVDDELLKVLETLQKTIEQAVAEEEGMAPGAANTFYSALLTSMRKLDSKELAKLLDPSLCQDYGIPVFLIAESEVYSALKAMIEKLQNTNDTNQYHIILKHLRHVAHSEAVKAAVLAESMQQTIKPDAAREKSQKILCTEKAYRLKIMLDMCIEDALEEDNVETLKNVVQELAVFQQQLHNAEQHANLFPGLADDSLKYTLAAAMGLVGSARNIHQLYQLGEMPWTEVKALIAGYLAEEIAEKKAKIEQIEGEATNATTFITPKPQFSEEKKIASLEKQTPDEIIPGLLLGNEVANENVLATGSVDVVIRLAFNEMKASHIPLNVQMKKMEEADAYALTEATVVNKNKKIVIHHFKIADLPGAVSKELLDVVYKIMDENLSAKKKILVHCSAGASRSPTFVIAYLMRQYELSFETAYYYVQHKRPCVDVVNFLPVLAAYENLWPSSVVQLHALLQAAVDAYHNAKKLPVLDPSAAITFTSDILSAIRKACFKQLLANPEDFGLPTFIFEQVKTGLGKLKNELQYLNGREEGQFIRALSHALTLGNIPVNGGIIPERVTLQLLQYRLLEIAKRKNIDAVEKEQLALTVINAKNIAKISIEQAQALFDWMHKESGPEKVFDHAILSQAAVNILLRKLEEIANKPDMAAELVGESNIAKLSPSQVHYLLSNIKSQDVLNHINAVAGVNVKMLQYHLLAIAKGNETNEQKDQLAFQLFEKNMATLNPAQVKNILIWIQAESLPGNLLIYKMLSHKLSAICIEPIEQQQKVVLELISKDSIALLSPHEVHHLLAAYPSLECMKAVEGVNVKILQYQLLEIAKRITTNTEKQNAALALCQEYVPTFNPAQIKVLLDWMRSEAEFGKALSYLNMEEVAVNILKEKFVAISKEPIVFEQRDKFARELFKDNMMALSPVAAKAFMLWVHENIAPQKSLAYLSFASLAEEAEKILKNRLQDLGKTTCKLGLHEKQALALNFCTAYMATLPIKVRKAWRSFRRCKSAVRRGDRKDESRQGCPS